MVEPPKTPALFLTGAVETETNLDEEEKTEERMEDLKNDNMQALEILGRHKAFNSKQFNYYPPVSLWNNLSSYKERELLLCKQK